MHTLRCYGNRCERTAQDGSVRRYLYDAAQQLTQVRSGSDTGAILAGYSYDNAGNQTQRSGTAALTLAYDALDRLASASGTGIAAESYRYDHQDRRIETVTNGTPKRFVYAGQELLSEYGADWSAAQAHYAYAGLDHPLLRNAPSGNAYYHADGLGSVVATSNAAGSITTSARYDAFGQTINKTGTIPRYGYAGREPDQTGLIYYRARYYDPGLGRFGQRDPAGFADGINPYAYVGNNPISFSDPLGLMKARPSPVAPSAFAGNGPNGSVLASLRNVAQTGLNFISPGGESFTNSYANLKAGNGSQAALWAIQGGLEFAAAGVTGGGSQALKGAFTKSVSEIKSGAFSIVDWAGYPAAVPKPTNPVNLISGAEYKANRAAADAANRATHRADPSIKPNQIHEIQPIKFEGSPTDPDNKVYLDRSVHQQVTNWWNDLQRYIEGVNK